MSKILFQPIQYNPTQQKPTNTTKRIALDISNTKKTSTRGPKTCTLTLLALSTILPLLTNIGCCGKKTNVFKSEKTNQVQTFDDTKILFQAPETEPTGRMYFPSPKGKELEANVENFNDSYNEYVKSLKHYEGTILSREQLDDKLNQAIPIDPTLETSEALQETFLDEELQDYAVKSAVLSYAYNSTLKQEYSLSAAAANRTKQAFGELCESIERSTPEEFNTFVDERLQNLRNSYVLDDHTPFKYKGNGYRTWGEFFNAEPSAAEKAQKAYCNLMPILESYQKETFDKIREETLTPYPAVISTIDPSEGLEPYRTERKKVRPWSKD